MRNIDYKQLLFYAIPIFILFSLNEYEFLKALEEYQLYKLFEFKWEGSIVYVIIVYLIYNVYKSITARAIRIVFQYIIYLYILFLVYYLCLNGWPALGISYMVLTLIVLGILWYADYTFRDKVKDERVESTPFNNKVEETRRKFAEKIFSRICTYSGKREAFNIAIIGEWGSGKTTFLSYVKDVAIHGNKTRVVEFNPWGISNESKLLNEILKALRDGVDNNSELARVLGDMITSTSSSLNWLNGILDTTTKDLDKLITELRDELRSSGIKLIILLDDVDRLDNSEIKQIFRILRTTLNLPGLFFIMGIDINYVHNTLTIYSKSNSKLVDLKQLDKYFQLRINLPVNSELVDIFLEEFINEFNLEDRPSRYLLSKSQKLIESYVNEGKITNLRDITNIIESCSFIYSCLEKQPDLCLILKMEVLRYQNYSIYELLYNNSLKYLAEKKHSGIGLKDIIRRDIEDLYIRFDPNIEDSMQKLDHTNEIDLNSSLAKRMWNDVNAMLDILNHDTTAHHSIEKEYYFLDYFTYNLYEGAISEDEFLRLMSNDQIGQIRIQLEKWENARFASPLGDHIKKFYEMIENFEQPPTPQFVTGILEFKYRVLQGKIIAFEDLEFISKLQSVDHGSIIDYAIINVKDKILKKILGAILITKSSEFVRNVKEVILVADSSLFDLYIVLFDFSKQYNDNLILIEMQEMFTEIVKIKFDQDPIKFLLDNLLLQSGVTFYSYKFNFSKYGLDVNYILGKLQGNKSKEAIWFINSFEKYGTKNEFESFEMNEFPRIKEIKNDKMKSILDHFSTG